MEANSIVRSDDLRSENRRRVLNALRSNGPSAPASLSNATGLSTTAISSLTGQLAEQGIVHSTRQKKPRSGASRGRPQSQIALNGSAGDIITLNIAIDLIHVRRISYAEKVLYSQSYDVNMQNMSESELLDVANTAINQAIQHNQDRPAHCIGVAFQGVTENVTGTLLWSPIIQAQNIPLGSILQANFRIPVIVNNDCRLLSEALTHQHHEQMGDSFVTVLFAHGVGLGLYINGQPFSGIGSSALELGHLRFEREGALCRCGKRGCIEAYAADYGILRLASGQSISDPPLGRIDPLQIQNLCDAANSGDEAAIQALAIAGASIGEGLAILFSLFDPMPVAIVGRNPQTVKLMLPGMNSVFRHQRGNAVAMDDLLHCFEDVETLLANGLARNTLAQVDRQFAYA